MFDKQNKKPKNEPIIKFRDFWKSNEEQTASSYRKLHDRIDRVSVSEMSEKRINWWKITTVAASVAMLIVFGLYRNARSGDPVTEMVYVADKPSQITLSDGTRVWLSSRSRLCCPQAFTGKTRDVTLSGEAYFEVISDGDHPFRVTADAQTVEVIGTRFNIRAYDDEPDITTALVEGSVRVTTDRHHDVVVLKPGQQICSPKTGQSFVVSDANIDMLMSWKTRKYVFNNQPFEDIARVLEKGFDVSIRIENEDLKKKPYTMRFENGESLERILDLIKVNAKYSYKYENGDVVIK